VSREKLSPQQRARLEAELREGPLAYGFAHDQRWTLGRVKTLIGRLFHVGCTVAVEGEAPVLVVAQVFDAAQRDLLVVIVALAGPGGQVAERAAL